ncbi:glycosyl hydrolase [Cesiribacter sp. SM1]|uniref:glycosyl hydrolase n=1 Tax=Cesiribacter sp. SM1 TaxID=2861196 RepID=UPI001CD4C80B|nr:glycosyl hydrolase [Cesiribacter sp. SM1]
MKLSRIFGVLIAGVVLVGLGFLVLYYDLINYVIPAEDRVEARFAEPVLAYFHQHQSAAENKVQEIRHYAVKWNNLGAWEPSQELEEALAEDGDLLLTVEIWPGTRKKGAYKATWKAISEGRYDKKIKQLCAAIANRQGLTYLRLNPEMEVPVELYPWQNQSPLVYIRGFRHFAGLCKQTAPASKIVWGPAGYPGAMEYWPGGDFVDVVSLTIRAQSEELTDVYPKDSSVTNIIRRKLHRLRFANKPALIMVTDKVNKEEYNPEIFKVDVDSIRQYLNAAVHNSASRPGSVTLAADYTAGEKKEAAKGLMLGVYDPELALTDHSAVSVEHIFTDIEEVRSGSFRKIFNEVVSRKHDVIVTMEPKDTTVAEGGPNVLEKTLRGDYDDVLQELYATISDAGSTVYLRWAHEMEIPITRYQWQSKDPVQYIKAFRYFVDFGAPLASNIRIVWGPAGDRGSLEWWPGDEYVDYISIAIYGLPDKNITDHRKQESFQQIFQRKFYRMRFVDKPIFITEFGVKGPDDYQERWLKGATKTIKSNPAVVGVCYFNLHDSPNAWGEIKAPDWSVSEASFNSFAESLVAEE